MSHPIEATTETSLMVTDEEDVYPHIVAMRQRTSDTCDLLKQRRLFRATYRDDILRAHLVKHIMRATEGNTGHYHIEVDVSDWIVVVVALLQELGYTYRGILDVGRGVYRMTFHD